MSAPPVLRKTPRQARAVVTFDVILDATAQLLAAGARATTNAIAARAGVSIGSLYQYFPDRAAVVTALVLREQASRAAGLRALVAGHRDTPLPQLLAMLIDAAIAGDEADPALAAALDREEARLGNDPAIEAAAATLDTAMLPLLAPVFPGDDPGTLAQRARLLRLVARTVIDHAMPDAGRARRDANALLLGYLAVAGANESA